MYWPNFKLPPINLWSLPVYKNDEAMNFELQPYQQDYNWLKARQPGATLAQLETFADKVAFAINDNPNQSIDEIRATVYRLMGF
jgi:hypothetical protein